MDAAAPQLSLQLLMSLAAFVLTALCGSALAGTWNSCQRLRIRRACTVAMRRMYLRCVSTVSHSNSNSRARTATHITVMTYCTDSNISDVSAAHWLLRIDASRTEALDGSSTATRPALLNLCSCSLFQVHGDTCSMLHHTTCAQRLQAHVCR